MSSLSRPFEPITTFSVSNLSDELLSQRSSQPAHDSPTPSQGRLSQVPTLAALAGAWPFIILHDRRERPIVLLFARHSSGSGLLPLLQFDACLPSSRFIRLTLGQQHLVGKRGDAKADLGSNMASSLCAVSGKSLLTTFTGSSQRLRGDLSRFCLLPHVLNR